MLNGRFGRARRVVWLLVSALACTAQNEAERRVDQKAVEELPILWETSGTWSHVSRPVRLVAYDAATLAQVPVAEVPVDFNSQMVLVAALGPTFGQDIGVRITRVWLEDSQVRVQERRLHPGLDRPGRLERSSPWTVVVVPRYEANVRGYSSDVPPGLLGG